MAYAAIWEELAPSISAVWSELDEQFGLEPSPETRALYEGLLKGTHLPHPVQASNTVTFLFTDIEESTNLLDKLGDQYAAVLMEHHRILRDAVQKWNGHEVATQGDAFFVTFGRSLDAVQCACEAQRALAAHSWRHGQPLRVRMGLHTGEALIASTGYVGMDATPRASATLLTVGRSCCHRPHATWLSTIYPTA